MSDRITAKFIDGPMLGQTVAIDRSPIMLRTADTSTNNGRALSRENEDPNIDEAVTAYIMDGSPSFGFWDGRDKRGRRTGGRMVLVRYRFFDPQPPTEILRSGAKWRAWCDGNRATLKAKYEASCRPSIKEPVNGDQ